MNDLAITDFPKAKHIFNQIYKEVDKISEGKLAEYIPELSN